jgi:hypothetical protein
MATCCQRLAKLSHYTCTENQNNDACWNTLETTEDRRHTKVSGVIIDGSEKNWCRIAHSVSQRTWRPVTLKRSGKSRRISALPAQWEKVTQREVWYILHCSASMMHWCKGWKADTCGRTGDEDCSSKSLSGENKGSKIQDLNQCIPWTISASGVRSQSNRYRSGESLWCTMLRTLVMSNPQNGLFFLAQEKAGSIKRQAWALKWAGHEKNKGEVDGGIILQNSRRGCNDRRDR